MRTLPFLKSKFQVELQDDADRSVLAEIFTLREYAELEPDIQKARRGILDLGAHKGFFVLYARALNNAVSVWAYEPEQDNFAALKRHLKLNSISGVTAKNAAVADTEESQTLHVSEDSHNHSLVVDPGGLKEQKVSVTTLEHILQKMGGCDLIKMDVEGSEFQILKAAGPLAWTVPVYFLEVHEYNPDMQASQLKAQFEQAGYLVKIVPSKYDKRLSFLWARRS